MRQSMYLEVTKAQLEGLSIGDKVTLSVEGVVSALRDGKDRPKTEKKRKGDLACYGDDMPPEITIKVTKETVEKVSENQFEQMADEDD